MFVVQSGTGNGKSAGVTDKNQLLVRGVVSGSLFEASENGDAYSIPTGFIALTNASGFSGIFYMETHPTMSHVNRIRLCAENTTRFKVYTNASTGTLISAGTALTAVNLNSGSGNEFDGTVLKGANGSTITDGDLLMCVVVQGGTSAEIFLDDSLLLGPNATLSIEAEPSTDGDVSATVIMYHHDMHGSGH